MASQSGRILIGTTSLLTVAVVAFFVFQNLVPMITSDAEPTDISPIQTRQDSLYSRYKEEGNALFNQGQYQEAKLKYEQALAQKPNDSFVKSNIEESKKQISDHDGFRCVQDVR